MLAIVAVPAVLHLRERPPAPPRAARLALPPPADAEPGAPGEPLDAAISPDETTLAFVATRAGVPRLWLRLVNDSEAVPLPGTEGAQLPAWKQTGRAIAFFAGGRLKQFTRSDLQVHDLAEARAPAGATWLADGSLVFAGGTPGPLQRMRFGEIVDATTLAADDQTHVFPVAVSGSDAFVYVAVRLDGRRVARLASGGLDRDLTVTSGHAALVGDQVLHVRDGVLFAYARNAETGELAPRGEPLALNVGVSATGRALFAASPRFILHAPAAATLHELAWLDSSGARLGSVGDAGDYWQVRLSPDDRQAAVTLTDPLLRALDIVLLPTGGAGDAMRLTTALAADTDPVWSPDGLRVLFRSMGSGRPDLFSRRIDARGETAYERVLQSELDETPTDWTDDRILFHARGARSVDVFALATGTAARTVLLDTPFNESDARVQPGGTWIAFVSDESGRPDIYARRAEAGAGRVRVSFAGGTRPRWTADGRAILFLRGTQVMRADMVEENRFTSARVLFEAAGMRDFDVAHRGERLLAILPVKTNVTPTVSAIVNWQSLLGARPPSE